MATEPKRYQLQIVGDRELAFGADVERFGSNRFANSSAADALSADSHAGVGPVGQRDVDFLQIRDKFSTGFARDLGTDSAQILRLTPGFDAVAHLDFLTARFALTCHRCVSSVIG